MNRFSDKILRTVIKALSILAIIFLLLAFYIPAKASIAQKQVANELGVKDVYVYTIH